MVERSFKPCVQLRISCLLFTKATLLSLSGDWLAMPAGVMYTLEYFSCWLSDTVLCCGFQPPQAIKTLIIFRWEAAL